MLSGQDISFVFNYWTLSCLGPTHTAAFVLISIFFLLFLIFLLRLSQVFSSFYKIILYLSSVSLALDPEIKGKGKGKVHRCTGTEALYRLYGP